MLERAITALLCCNQWIYTTATDCWAIWNKNCYLQNNCSTSLLLIKETCQCSMIHHFHHARIRSSICLWRKEKFIILDNPKKKNCSLQNNFRFFVWHMRNSQVMTIYIILIPGNVSLHATAFTFSMRSAASWTVAMFSAPPSPIDTPHCSSNAIIISTWSYLQCL